MCVVLLQVFKDKMMRDDMNVVGGVFDSEYFQDGIVDLWGNFVLKVNIGGWKVCFYIFGNECCECLVYYGIVINFVIYLLYEFY